ncbi:polysialyltransferase family glycosyltransferase [Thiomicrorhabdus sediminis]|uniref:Uncharacterized protein n=1 Tax=Thiomicrorhabdus sediminis TaxID=2580412 RepID=A0A4V1HHZ1_9GAMM|nr:polysialyltransferase family glycosyltransferase [Thiomicrorhabdus sediminis]QCU90703.1 hypothetical protein FE785_08710 [Thiomicrorhabdus sediminis]
MKNNVIYMPSTPLNVMVSLAHATAHKELQNAYLVLIDQKNVDNNPYYNCLKQSELFTEVHILPGMAHGKEKLAERSRNFQQIKQWCERWRPAEILVGSDRRVEFQYAMSVSQQWGSTGAYLDDGLYTYAGKPRAWYKDPLNSLIKKIAYGWWWKEPVTVGASSWIQTAYVFQPTTVVDELKQKECRKLQPEWFLLPDIKAMTYLILEQFDFSDSAIEDLSKIDLLLTFPHPNDIDLMQGYRNRVEQFLERANDKGLNVAVKYHPRMAQADEWSLQQRFNIAVLPSNLAFEFLLPFLKSNMIVLGDVGTVVMTAKWLRPDLRTMAVLNGNDAYASQFRPVMNKLGISLIDSFHEAIELER